MKDLETSGLFWRVFGTQAHSGNFPGNAKRENSTQFYRRLSNKIYISNLMSFSISFTFISQDDKDDFNKTDFVLFNEDA